MLRSLYYRFHPNWYPAGRTTKSTVAEERPECRLIETRTYNVFKNGYTGEEREIPKSKVADANYKVVVEYNDGNTYRVEEYPTMI